MIWHIFCSIFANVFKEMRSSFVRWGFSQVFLAKPLFLVFKFYPAIIFFFFWNFISKGGSQQVLRNNGNSNNIPVAKQLKFIMEKIVMLQYFQQELRSTNWSQDYLLRHIQPQDWTPLTKIEDSCCMKPKPSIYSVNSAPYTQTVNVYQ